MHGVSGSALGEVAVRSIVQLYVIEQQAPGMTSTRRLAPRGQYVVPLLADMQVFVADRSAKNRRWERCPQRLLNRRSSAGQRCSARPVRAALPIDKKPVDNAIRHRQR